MRSLFRRIPGGQELPGDLATGDWSPVPAAVSAQALDLEALLATEEVPLPRYAMQDWEPASEEAIGDGGCWLPLPADPEPRTAARSPSRSAQFTPEELAIIEEQRRAAAAPAPPVASEPQPEPLPASEPRHSWVEVLKSFGESLTDSELRIIREQLAT